MVNPTSRIAAVAGLLLCSATTAVHAGAAPPLVDGDCADFPTNHQQQPLGLGLNLRIFQDQHFVWFCYEIPEGSWGTVDLRIEAPALDEALNLHVSAQLGEWPADRSELAPADAQSDRWWQTRGWTANWVWLNGYRTNTRGERAVKFKLSPARELQLSKARFGRGEWKLHFDIGLRDDDGEPVRLHFPAGEGHFTLQVH